MLLIEVQVPLRLNLNRFLQPCALAGHHSELQFVVRNLMPLKKHTLALGQKLLSLHLAHVRAPLVLHEHLAEVERVPGSHKVMLNLESVHVYITQEGLVFKTVPTSEHSVKPEWRHLHPPLVVAQGEPVEVSAGGKESGSIILNLVLLLHLLELLLQLLSVSHLSSASKHTVLIKLKDASGIVVAAH